VIEREHPRTAYIAVRGTFVAQTSPTTRSLPRAAIPDAEPAIDEQRESAFQTSGAVRPSQRTRSPGRGTEKLHRRTICDTLKRERRWTATSKVDGWIEFTPPASILSIDAFADEVRLAVTGMGYTPTVRISRDRTGRSVVRVHTPETLDQAGRGGHGF
jgi:hypothetical protein